MTIQHQTFVTKSIFFIWGGNTSPPSSHACRSAGRRLRSQAAEKISRTAKTAASFAEAAFKKAEEALKQKRREMAEKKEKRIMEEGFSFEEGEVVCCDDGDETV